MKPFSTYGQNVIKNHNQSMVESGRNQILNSFLDSTTHQKYRKKYSISGGGEQDIFRDIIVLKSASQEEKGVVLLKYAQTFEAFLYFFDIHSLLKDYYFVLEPCWAGYYNTNIFMWLFPETKNRIIVQCYTQEDHEIISALKPFFLPVNLGPADWVNSDNFKPTEKQEPLYDIIMVANWAAIKQHKLLFQALQKIENREINVLLIGYAWGGRTSKDIEREASVISNDLIHVTIKENLPHSEVVKNLNRSKMFVFLTRKEGDNKALVEAMFTDVPVIVYRETVGGAKSRVNNSTGILTSYEDLHQNILYMLDNYLNFKPRQWCLEHTGSYNSTRKLNNLVKKAALENGENYTIDIVEKINTPNLEYKESHYREKFSRDYKYIANSKRIKAG